MNYCLAIDIGASSGRHILGHIENGRLILEEVHRFENYLRNENGLFQRLKTALQNAEKSVKSQRQSPLTPGESIMFCLTKTKGKSCPQFHTVIKERRKFRMNSHR